MPERPVHRLTCQNIPNLRIPLLKGPIRATSHKPRTVWTKLRISDFARMFERFSNLLRIFSHEDTHLVSAQDIEVFAIGAKGSPSNVQLYRDRKLLLLAANIP